MELQQTGSLAQSIDPAIGDFTVGLELESGVPQITRFQRADLPVAHV